MASYQILGGKTVNNIQINQQNEDMAETAERYVDC